MVERSKISSKNKNHGPKKSIYLTPPFLSSRFLFDVVPAPSKVD